MKAAKLAPLKKKRMEDFIYLYLQISPEVCRNAFSSHYGHEGPAYFKQLEKLLAKQKMLSSQPSAQPAEEGNYKEKEIRLAC